VILLSYMPQLTWIGKDKVENHDKDLPFRVLKPNKKLSVGDNDNLLIQGDNLEALKALMPFYYNKIKCIYIDPPYNTGNEKWVYNDKVNSPQIKSWLNKVVGGQDEDLCRHDKWLCMMFPRLKLLHDLLAEEGSIFISIDDNEVHNLRNIMDQIFGEKNFLVLVSWRKKKEIASDNKGFSSKVEYVLGYSKSSLFSPNKVPLREEYLRSSFKNPNNDPRGDWRGVAITASKGHQGGGYEYTVTTPSGKTVKRIWLYPENSYKNLEKDGKLYFGVNGSSVPQRIMYANESTGQIPDNLWLDYGTNKDGKNEISAIFGKALFDTPKPTSLVKQILRIATNKNDLVLDSFAGSGTTGQAVLETNKEDGGNRKFILVELEEKIAKEITAERLRKVITGYKEAKFPKGTGQGFQYLDLNGELFNKSGFINDVVNYEDLASYVYFTETKSYLDLKVIDKPYIGSFGSNNYFLLFEGKGKNVLDEKVFKELSKYSGKKIIFADKCLLDEDLCEKYNVIFKQIPYELKKY
jgi:adenine-specific DNA-methyltransferase